MNYCCFFCDTYRASKLCVSCIVSNTIVQRACLEDFYAASSFRQ